MWPKCQRTSCASFPTDAPPTAGKSGIDDLLSTTPNGAERPTLTRAVSSSTSAMEDDEEWKPNTWHFGRPASHTPPSTNSNTEAEGYRGWNDAPPPPNAVVARAYAQPRQSHHRLLNDLAAGLPAQSRRSEQVGASDPVW
ncbi:hypothetical protein L1887_55076 [Cichorium endivia]|nr:hypothetical protein L1887_55076 [Cichorium endivia]